MASKYTDDFKRDAVRYAMEHRDISYREASKNLGIPYDTLYDWIKKEQRESNPKAFDESGNLSDVEKENIRLRRELRDAKDALEILKKAIGILGD